MAAEILILDPGEKAVVGNMMIENTNEILIELAVEGDGPVLREKMMIKAEDAVSPALKIYYMVMKMYLDPDGFENMHMPFLDLSRELITEVPSTGMIMADIGENLIGGEFRNALDICYLLIQYEHQLENIAIANAKG